MTQELETIKKSFEEYISTNKLKGFKVISIERAYMILLSKEFSPSFVCNHYMKREHASTEFFKTKTYLSLLTDIAIRVDIKNAQIYVKHDPTSERLFPHAGYGSPTDDWYPICCGSLGGSTYKIEDYFRYLKEAIGMCGLVSLDEAHLRQWKNNSAKKWKPIHNIDEIMKESDTIKEIWK